MKQTAEKLFAPPPAPSRVRLASALLVPLLLAPLAAAHGDLEINELETLAIRDFEGQEDSFPWEGFEIWDVYVGEGYNESLDSDGVYFKVNFAGDGTKRSMGGKAWTVAFTFKVGEESFERQLTHDGTTITTSFESLQWVIADGNVLQVKAWAPIEYAMGKSVRDIVIVSSVDEKPRDSAPGGVHDPATSSEAPVQAPSTLVFPPMGEGRIVEEVPLLGPGKYFDLAILPKGNNTFTLTVTNALKGQGQHVMLRPGSTPGWELVTKAPPHSLEGGKSGSFDVQLVPTLPPGSTLAPYSLDIVSDIGGHRTVHAFLGDTGVELVEDQTLARSAAIVAGERETPFAGLLLVIALVTLPALLRRR